MTKTWEDVREETCRLYKQGWSLERIRKHLRERQFEASTRAFRGKLKDWKAKKSDASNACEAVINHHSQTDYEAFNDPVYELQFSTDEQFYHPEQAPIRESQIASCYDLILESLQNSERCSEILRHCDFTSHHTSILHLAIKKAVMGTTPVTANGPVSLILEYMKSSDIDVDIPDEQGCTPLELAIRLGRHEFVEQLLRQHASTNRANSQGLRPLHIALLSGASPGIHLQLLHCSADANVKIPVFNLNVPTVTPLCFAVQLLSESASLNPDRAKYWFSIVAHLISARAKWKLSDLENILRSFLECWIQSQGRGDLLQVCKPVIGEYLRIQPDALLSGFSKLRVLPCSCLSFLDYALWHSPDNTFAEFLISHAAATVYLPRIAKVITAQRCYERGLHRPDHRQLLRTLLSKIPSDAECNLVIVTLSTRSNSGEYVSFLKDILAHRPQDGVHDMKRAGTILRGLRYISDNDEWYDIVDTLFCPARWPYGGVLQQMLGVSVAAILDGQDILQHYHWMACWNTAVGRGGLAMLHVATKEALNRIQAKDPELKIKLRNILSARHSRGLRSIPVPEKLILAVLNI